MNDSTMHEILSDTHISTDIGIYYCGKRIKTPDHEYGPEIRTHYLFVLVNKGEADMISPCSLRFGEHDLLIMHPNEKIHYKALDEWSISWIGLYGKSIGKYIDFLKITPQNPIVHISLYSELKDVMDKIYEISGSTSISSKLSVTGLIYEFFAILMKNSQSDARKNLIDTALNIIDYNFCSDISVEKISKSLAVDPSYFSRKFTEKMNMSPKRYIIEKRLTRAKELLISTDATVYEISNSVGYQDQFYFCKLFKKFTNVSPTEYRKNSRRYGECS